MLDSANLELVGNIEDESDNPVLLLDLSNNTRLNALQNTWHRKEQCWLQARHIISQFLDISLQVEPSVVLQLGHIIYIHVYFHYLSWLKNLPAFSSYLQTQAICSRAHALSLTFHIQTARYWSTPCQSVSRFYRLFQDFINFKAILMLPASKQISVTIAGASTADVLWSSILDKRKRGKTPGISTRLGQRGLKP